MKELDALMNRMKLRDTQEWKRAAFISHQAGAGGKKNFGEYLTSVGIGVQKKTQEDMNDDDWLQALRLMNAAMGGTEVIIESE
jgi:hypothetical protein